MSALNAQVDMEDRGIAGQRSATVFEKAKPDQVVAADQQLSVALRVDLDDATLSLERGGHVEIVVGVQRHALRTAEAAVEDGGVSVGVDRVDTLVAAGGGSGDQQRAVVAEGKVVGGDRRFERGEDKHFARGLRSAGAYFEDRARAVADKKVAAGVEGEPGGDAHAFGEGRDRPLRGDAVDRAFRA